MIEKPWHHKWEAAAHIVSLAGRNEEVPGVPQQVKDMLYEVWFHSLDLTAKERTDCRTLSSVVHTYAEVSMCPHSHIHSNSF